MSAAPVLTGGVELVDVPELQSIQGDGLVQNREGAAVLQQLVQLQVLREPQGVLLRTDVLLHDNTHTSYTQSYDGDIHRGPARTGVQDVTFLFLFIFVISRNSSNRNR